MQKTESMHLKINLTTIKTFFQEGYFVSFIIVSLRKSYAVST